MMTMSRYTFPSPTAVGFRFTFSIFAIKCIAVIYFRLLETVLQNILWWATPDFALVFRQWGHASIEKATSHLPGIVLLVRAPD